jgi:hypothetical protein
MIHGFLKHVCNIWAVQSISANVAMSIRIICRIHLLGVAGAQHALTKSPKTKFIRTYANTAVRFEVLAVYVAFAVNHNTWQQPRVQQFF